VNACSAAVMIAASIASWTAGRSVAGVWPSISAASSSRNAGSSTAAVTSRCRAPRAETIEPPLRQAVNALRQPGRGQHRASAGDPHGVIVAQAADQLGHERGVAGGAAGQVRQGLVRRCAEGVSEHGRHRVLVRRGPG
jgi:hypothetical protein